MAARKVWVRMASRILMLQLGKISQEKTWIELAIYYSLRTAG